MVNANANISRKREDVCKTGSAKMTCVQKSVIDASRLKFHNLRKKKQLFLTVVIVQFFFLFFFFHDITDVQIKSRRFDLSDQH